MGFWVQQIKLLENLNQGHTKNEKHINVPNMFESALCGEGVHLNVCFGLMKCKDETVSTLV